MQRSSMRSDNFNDPLTYPARPYVVQPHNVGHSAPGLKLDVVDLAPVVGFAADLVVHIKAI
jgi:hypothetical protein